MKLSIITATFNCGSILSGCLDSVASQDALEHIEHIIIDGASNDNTLEVAASYPHIKQIYSRTDRGIYHAFNRGLELATGDLIYFLGADDTLYNKSTISAVLSSFEQDDIDFVITRVHCFNQESGETWVTQSELREAVNVCHQGFFCRKSLFEKIGPFNECLKLCADTLFMRTAIKKYKGKSLNLISANFRQGGVSSHGSNRLRLRKELEVISVLQGDNITPKDHHLDKNVSDLKLLIEKSLVREKIRSKYSGKRLAIFGTRQLSISIAKLLLSVGANVECFVVSNETNRASVIDIPVVSLSFVTNFDISLLINCIEGEHESKVSEDIKNDHPEFAVMSWRDL
ncbi:glycosyltransferase [Alteromonas mediterranea]|uniref:Glycosyltransferase n=1 Tax=Alteromonas mediterranea TaxID=314275 RepID=A0AAC9NQ41_9ALTE|nr:glycosyltransferase family 2 protein [Alteromonas mediterranea]APD89130.1 glycosyltransferase [Alteromonas mediterranea]